MLIKVKLCSANFRQTKKIECTCFFALILKREVSWARQSEVKYPFLRRTRTPRFQRLTRCKKNSKKKHRRGSNCQKSHEVRESCLCTKWHFKDNRETNRLITRTVLDSKIFYWWHWFQFQTLNLNIFKTASLILDFLYIFVFSILVRNFLNR